MTTVTSTHAAGILPDSVIRDHRSNGYFVFLTLSQSLQPPDLQSWLQGLSGLIQQLEGPLDGEREATAAVGFGPSFFQAAGQPRFGMANAPADFGSLPALPTLLDSSGAADVVIYVMSLSEAIVAAFLRGLIQIQPGTIAGAAIERGYQRTDGREQFGFRDGLRNVAPDRRNAVVFVDLDNQPDEPFWADGGSYMAYLKINQNLAAAQQAATDQMQENVGRRITDGSRLDLPEGTNPQTEGTFANPTIPPVTSHVRKAGPRDSIHDLTEIFRRGVPYTDLKPDGTLDAGLQFASFQCTLDNFNVILNRWMLNQNFPTPGAGSDALFANGLITIEKGGYYFVPPADPRYIGARFFDPLPPDPCTIGRAIIRKQVVDPNNQPVLVDLGGFQFQILDTAGQAVDQPFTTDSAGHAVSPELQRGENYTLEEINVPTGFQPATNQPFTLNARRQVLTAINQIQGPTPPYNP